MLQSFHRIRSVRTSRPVLLLTQNSCPLHFFVKSIAFFSRDLISDPYNTGLYTELNIVRKSKKVFINILSSDWLLGSEQLLIWIIWIETKTLVFFNSFPVTQWWHSVFLFKVFLRFFVEFFFWLRNGERWKHTSVSFCCNFVWKKYLSSLFFLDTLWENNIVFESILLK